MAIINARAAGIDNIDLLANGALNNKSTPGGITWLDTGATTVVQADPDPSHTGDKSLKMTSVGTGVQVDLGILTADNLVWEQEFYIDSTIASTVLNIHNISARAAVERFFFVAVKKIDANNFEITWYGRNDAANLRTVLDWSTYTDTWITIGVDVDYQNDTMTCYINGAVAEDTDNNVPIIDVDAYWNEVAGATKPTDLRRFIWQTALAGNIGDVDGIFLDYNFASALVPFDTTKDCIYYEAWLYLDDATHKYANISTRQGDTAIPARITSISPVRHELGSSFGGASIGSVTVLLVNTTAHGTAPARNNLEFSKLFDNIDGDEWLNRKMEVYLATRTSGITTRTKLFTGALSSVVVTGINASVVALSEVTARMGTITPVQVTAATFPAPSDGAIGQYLPIVIGSPDVTPPSGAPGPTPAHIIDTANKKIGVASHQTSAAPSFSIWFNDGDQWQAVPGAAISARTQADATYPGAGTITTATLTNAGGYVFDATHIFATDIDGIINSTPAVISNPVEALRAIGVTYAGMLEGDFDASVDNTETVTTAESLTTGAIITEPLPYLEFLAQITAAFDIDSFFTREGKLGLDYFVPTVVTLETFTDTSHIYTMPVMSYSTERGDGRRALANQIISNYDFHPITGVFYSTEQADDLVAQASMLRVYNRTEDNMYVIDAGVMDTVNAHRLTYRSKPLQKVQFTVSPELIPDKMPTSIIGLTHFAGLDADGSGWVGVPIRIESIEYRPNEMNVFVEAIRVSSWLEDAYIFHDQDDVTLLDGGSDGTVSVVAASPTVTLTTAEADGLAQGNIFEINTVNNAFFAFINTIDTVGDTFTLNDEPDGSGAAVNMSANETTNSWRITKNWDQGTAEDKVFGGLAETVEITSTGTVAVVSGESVVTGTATQFVTDGVEAGDEIVIRHVNGVWAKVKSVTSETQLIMTAVVPGAVAAGTSFEIYDKDMKIPPTTAGRRI